MRIAYFGRIVMRGNSYCVVVPKEIRTITETERGDLVRIEIEKVEINDPNLHANYAAQQDPEARDNGIHQDARHTQMDNSEGNRVTGIRTLASEDIHFGIICGD